MEQVISDYINAIITPASIDYALANSGPGVAQGILITPSEAIELRKRAAGLRVAKLDIEAALSWDHDSDCRSFKSEQCNCWKQWLKQALEKL
jgi:hypothetical protein